MKHRYPRFCAMLALATAMTANVVNAHATATGCGPVHLVYVERIESQGFLGLATPKADATLVSRAVKANLDEARDVRDALGERKTETGRTLHFVYSNTELERRDFPLEELCRIVAARGAHQLVFACHADSESALDSERGYEASQGHGRVMTDCLVSAYPGRNFKDWQELRAYELAGTGMDTVMYGDADRHDYLADKTKRSMQYGTYLQYAVYELVNSGSREEWLRKLVPKR